MSRCIAACGIDGWEHSIARQFDGISDYVVTASALTLSGSPKLTLAFWLWWDAYDNLDANSLLALGNGTSQTGTIYLAPNSTAGTFKAFVLDAPATQFSYEFARPSAAAWHHYVMSMDRSLTGAAQLTGLWVDGATPGSLAIVTADDLTGNWIDDVVYSMSYLSGTFPGAGRLAEEAWYSGYNFVQADVDALYNGGAGAIASAVGTPTYYWRIPGLASPEPFSVGGINLTVSGTTFVAHPFTDAPPMGQALLPEQQWALPRPQYPLRRARRAIFPGKGSPPPPPINAGSLLFPDHAPGPRRAAYLAYQLRQFTVELYAAQTPIQTQSRLLPNRAPGPRRAGRTAYQIDTDLDSLYAPAPLSQEEETFATRTLSPTRAPGRPRAARRAYALDPAPPDLFGNALPPGNSLFPDRQIAKERPQYPDRRARRKTFPGSALAGPQLDFAELFGGRALMPDHAPGPRRADRTAYIVADNRVDFYVPPPIGEVEETFSARQLLPSQAPGQARAARDAYGLIDNRVDLYAPAPLASAPELFPNFQQLPDRVPPARRRFRNRMKFPGGTQAFQVAEGQSLLPFKTYPRRRAANEAYQIDTFPVDIFAANKPEEIWSRLIPDRVFAPRRACRDAYLLAPSLVELYAAQTPTTITSALLPERAPGPRRAARQAYALENNAADLYAPPFVTPSLTPTRMLLGVGL